MGLDSRTVGDLFLHLPFARRLRLAAGLHPLAAEALVRRPALVALGAALPHLPAVERKGMSFFRRLFAGGGKSARWQKLLEGDGTARPELVVELLVAEAGAAGESGPGPLARLALGLGLLSHEVLASTLRPVFAALPENQRAAVARGQARLWLQQLVPPSGDLQGEWRAVLELQDVEQHKRVVEHVHAALARAFGTGPGPDVLQRWLKGLVAEVSPLVDGSKGALPPEAGMADADVQKLAFDGDAAFL
jgi:hypothetical protein